MTAALPVDAKFLPTRFRVRLLPRMRLLERLDDVLRSGVTVVRTPAGYGKTTLLSQWHEALLGRDCRVIWIALDQEESEPAAFAAQLARAAALQGLCSQALAQAAAITTPGMSPRHVIGSLLSELGGIEAPVVLFLDDYHVIVAPELNLLVSDLLRSGPDNLHVVIATRSKPGLPMSMLRTTIRMQELTVEDLRFSKAEISAFLGDGFDGADVALLATRTEGWPVALQIAHLWIGDREEARSFIARFSGSTQEMAGYMVDQVMRQLPPATRDFLVSTSILRRINGDLANAICGREDCWQMLDEVERLNALIFPLDAGRSWYRHHHLFADFLRSELARRGEVAVAMLHRRASAWFAAHGDLSEAVDHARASGDVDLALALLDDVGLLYRMLRDGADVYRKFKVLFTPQALDAYPRVATAQALLWIKDGDYEEAQILLDSIAAKLSAGHYDAPRFRRDQLAGDVLIMASFLSNYIDGGVSVAAIAAMEAQVGRSNPVDHWYRALIHNLVCTMHFHRGNLVNATAAAHASIDHFSLAGLDYGLFFLAIHLGALRLLRGDLRGAIESAAEATRIVESVFPFDDNLRALGQIFAAEVAFERNRRDDTSAAIFDALRQVGTADGWIEMHLSGYRTALGLAYGRNGLAGIEPVLTMGRRFARRRGLPRLEWYLLAREAHYLTIAGAVAKARTRMDECTSALAALRERFDEAQIWRERQEHAATLAHLLIAECRAGEAIALLESRIPPYEASEHFWRVAQALLLLALAHHAEGRIDEAARYLRQAMHLTREDRLQRPFLDGGPDVEGLVKSVLSHVGISAFSAATLDWAAEILSAFGAAQSDRQGTLIGSVFTQREQEVLSCLKAGRSNKAIARELQVTDNAVKFHLKNIYRKLGVNDRRLALSAARKHGLTV